MSSPIRVLQVFGALNRGGSETMIMNLYRNVDRTKVQFDFVKHVSEKCAYEDEINLLGGCVFIAPKFKVYNYFGYRKWWKKFLESHQEYKVIHGHLFTIASIYFGVAHQMNRITIGHSHISKLPLFSIKGMLKRFFLRRLSRNSDYKFACSQTAGKFVYGKNVFEVWPNAIDLNQFVFSEKNRNKIRDEFNIQDRLVIGNIGRLTSQKNQNFLIDVLKKIHEKNAKTSLIVVGTGELETKLKSKVKSLSLEDSVIFTGSRTDVPALLSAMDVFVFPSLYEGLPVTVIEAQACGLPCIVSDTITKEVDFAKKIDFLELSKGSLYWADVVLKKSIKRFSLEKEICNAGYEIRESANRLTNFYVNL